MNKLTKTVLTGVAALGLIGGGLVAGGAPQAEAKSLVTASYTTKSSCLTAKMDILMSGNYRTIVNCGYNPLSGKYLLVMQSR